MYLFILTLYVDDTLDQILRFITGLRTRKIINREDAVILEEYLFGDNLLIPSAYAVALSTIILISLQF